LNKLEIQLQYDLSDPRGRRGKNLTGQARFKVKNWILEAISKMQITFKDKARADEKAQHTREYVSILRRSATP
jgi:hypothetical protein